MILNKLGAKINQIMEVIGIAILTLMIFATSLQVISRYIFNAALSWTDELSRYCFIWSSMIGASVAFWRGSHAAVDVLVANFKGKIQIAHKTIVYLLITYMSLVLAIKGFQAVMIVHTQNSTAMHIPMSLVYASLPINAVIIAFYAIVKTIELYQKCVDSQE